MSLPRPSWSERATCSRSGRAAAARRRTLVRPRERASNPDRALQLVAGLQHLLPEVRRQLRVRREIVVDQAERDVVVLAANESAEPGAEEKDAPVALNPRQAVERGREVADGERALVGVVEGAQTRRHPLFVESGVGKIACE